MNTWSAESVVDGSDATAADGAPSDAPRYEEVGTIGQGGMGRVVLVRDREMRREVALKELTPTTATNPRAVQRFLREARVTAQLEHPGVIPVYELGRRADGSPFYTMKRIRGRTLRDAITAATTLPSRLDLFDHFVDLCQAVAYAHSRGVCHRDLKPENVMIGAFGETVVMDWGLVHLGGVEDTEPDASVPLIDSGDDLATAHGTVLGTPQYMSPEQVRGEHVGPASDVWSLGVMLHELLYGAHPFTAPNRPAVFARVLAGWTPPPAPRDAGGAVPPELVAVLKRALAPDRAARYPDAAALVEDLDAWRKGQRVGAYTYSTIQVLRRWVKRHRFAVGTALTAATLVLLVGAYAFTQVAHERDVAEQALGRATSEALLAKAREAVLLRRPDRAVGYLLGGLDLAAEAERAPFSSELAAAHALLPPSVVLAEAGERTVGVWASGDGEALYAVGPTGETVRWSDDGERRAVATIEGQVVGLEAKEGQDLVVIYARPEGGGALRAHVLRGDPLTLAGTLALRADTLKSSQIAPSGRVLAVEDNTGALELWDLATSRPLSTQPPDEYVRYAFVGDDLLATCSPMRANEAGVTLVSVVTGELVHRLATLGGRCRRVYAAGGGLVAESYGMDRHYWADPTVAEPTWRAEIGKSEEAWSDAARDLLITDWRDGKLTVHRLSTGELRWETQRDHRDASFRFSAQGVPRIATFDADRISVLDAASGALVGVLPTQTASASRVAFLSGDRLATLAPTGELRRWSSVREGTPRIVHEREGAQVVSLAEADGALRVAHIFGMAAVPWPAGGEPAALATMVDKVPCVIAGRSGALDVLWANRCRAAELDMGFGSGAGLTLARHAADGTVLASVTRAEALGGSAAVEGLGGGLAASVGDGDCISVLSLEAAAERQFCTEGRRYLATAIAPDGKLLAGGHAVGVTLWDAATGAPIAELGAGSAVARMAWSPSGHRLAVVAGGRLFVASARDVGGWTIEDRQSPVPVASPVGWSADGEWTVSGTQAGAVALFPAQGDPRLLATGSSDRPWAFAFSPDGKWLGVGREGGRVEVFDLAGDGLLLSILLDTRLVLALGWASDGGTLFAGGEERVYALPVRGPGALLAHAESLTNLRLCPDSLELVPAGASAGGIPRVAPAERCGP